MLDQYPLTPPNDASTEADAFHIGVTPQSMPNPYATYGLLNTPASMGFDGPEDRADQEEVEPPTISDEEDDRDMTDGGILSTMSLAQAVALNNEMDMVDAEVMGVDNLLDIAGLDSYFNTPFFADFATINPLWSNVEALQHMDGLSAPANLPPVMSAVSQVLQNLQDGQNEQEHAELVTGAGVLHGANLQQSTPSILLPFSHNSQNEDVGIGSSLPNFVTMSQIAPAILPVPVPMPVQQPAWSQAWTGYQIPPTQLGNPTPSHIIVVNDDDFFDADHPEAEDVVNLTLERFLHTWATSASSRSPEHAYRKGPSIASIREHRLETPQPMVLNELQGDRCDIQRIDWKSLGVSRLAARQQRRATYKNYTNLRFDHQWHPRLNGARLEDDQNFFRFRRMDFNHSVNLAHFQLRNLLACASRDHVFYAGKAQIFHWDPYNGSSQPEVALDLRSPTVQPAHWQLGNLPGIQVSTLTVNHDILVAGGFSGEYALTNLRSQKGTLHTEGLVTKNANSITNRIQVHLTPSSNAPVVAFASNDNFLRVLDVGTNTFIASHKYNHAINCSAISPDMRLRCLVGDNRQVMICNAETGEILQSLEGHRDYGFACDWADDGWTVATGNQDMQVKIWDARKWTNSSGVAQCLATIAAEMAGVRSLKFSPLGSGKRVLLAAEPADIISVIDGETFTSKQTLSFFGDIGGLDFANDGQDLWVGNCDDMRGGLMQYERCDLASHGLYGLEDCNPRQKNRNRQRGQGYDWKRTDEELKYHPGARGTEEQRHRRVARLGTAMGHF
ncbi:related to vegetatible incompatibility protein het-e-1 [Rhynchosporium secalis]|uniref:Related to vegetatible incompatibility protein het-e-1 n=1 Tax=Rhynchosporium secalis TaxID=38038 RepID=A0A1E1MLC4_RHYSE|nr:related to vegetatible incompatibility protein het-e-1 [Rhynchosporium secalis]